MTTTRQQQTRTAGPGSFGGAKPARAPGAAPAAGAPATTGGDPPSTPVKQRGLVRAFAARYQIDPDQLLKILKDTAFKQPGKMKGDRWEPGPEVTNEQMFALLVVANEYHLNPFTKEIYAFQAKGGGIVPIISIDGWIRIVNERPELEWFEFQYPPAGVLREDYYVTCIMKRRDREQPVMVTEYFAECYRDTDPWNQTGRRMNRHRAFIQAARLCFGYGGVYDPDEGERILDNLAIDTTATDVTDRKPVTAEPRARVAGPKAEAAGGPQQGSMLDTPPTIDDVKQLLSSTGVPDNECLAHFEVGDLDQLTPVQIAQAVEWLNGVNRG